MHMHVLKFELILRNNFQVMSILRDNPINKKARLKLFLSYSLKKTIAKIIPNFYYISRYLLMPLCYVECLSRFRAQIFELWPF